MKTLVALISTVALFIGLGLMAQAPMPAPFIGGPGGGGGGGNCPGGSDTQVQFNDGGTNCGGDAGFTYNKTTDVASLTGGLSTGSSPPACVAGTAGVICLKEGTAPTGETGAAQIYSKTDHLLYTKLNNAAETAICTIASGCGSSGSTIYDVQHFLPNTCQGGTSFFAQVDTTSSGTFVGACVGGSNNKTAFMGAIPATGATAYIIIPIPGDWDTTIQPWVKMFYNSGLLTSGTVIWTTGESCYKSDGSVDVDGAYNAESSMAPQTMTTAGRGWAQSAQLTQVTSGNNCVPGGMMQLRFVLSGTGLINVIQLTQINVTFARTNSAGAN